LNGQHTPGLAKVKLGVMIGYWGFGMTAAAGLEVAQAAERLGYD